MRGKIEIILMLIHTRRLTLSRRLTLKSRPMLALIPTIESTNRLVWDFVCNPGPHRTAGIVRGPWVLGPTQKSLVQIWADYYLILTVLKNEV